MFVVLSEDRRRAWSREDDLVQLGLPSIGVGSTALASFSARLRSRFGLPIGCSSALLDGFLVAAVTGEGTGRSELTELMADHVLGDQDLLCGLRHGAHRSRNGGRREPARRALPGDDEGPYDFLSPERIALRWPVDNAIHPRPGDLP